MSSTYPVSWINNAEIVAEGADVSGFDGAVVVAESFDAVNAALSTAKVGFASGLSATLKSLSDVDASAATAKNVLIFPLAGAPGNRVVFSGTGKLNDYDDVRSYAEAAEAGIKKAVGAGCKSPLIVLPNPGGRFPQSDIVTALGVFSGLYVPLEVREQVPSKAAKVEKVGIQMIDGDASKVELVKALEAGRLVSRDIGGSDPERMASPRVAEYVKETFSGTNVKVEVMEGQAFFEKEYPCLAAVNRAASVIPRHDGRIVWMTYEPEGEVKETLMLVGKGITYDTGGCDIKAGGIMAGMSRDKCGAADVAGIVKAVSILKPKHLKVVGAMAMVRNSVGENAYVSDEIITSRAGVRLRVGNTDAEGRMAMVDVLCRMKELALNEVNPHLFTIATLTGHAVLAMGPCTAVMDNSVALKEVGMARQLQAIGQDLANPMEVSTLRREEFRANADKSGEFVEILQSNNLPSVQTARGHHLGPAFMIAVSGLDKHGLLEGKSIKYTHLDIAGSAGKLPEPTTGSSVAPMVMKFIQGNQ